MHSILMSRKKTIILGTFVVLAVTIWIFWCYYRTNRLPQLEGEIDSAQIDVLEQSSYGFEPTTYHLSSPDDLQSVRQRITPISVYSYPMDTQAYPVLARVKLKMSSGKLYIIDVHTLGKNPAVVSINGRGYYWCSNALSPNGDGALGLVNFASGASHQEGKP